MKFRVHHTFIVCRHLRDWRIVPVYFRRSDSWPRLLQLAWLCFFYQRVTWPA